MLKKLRLTPGLIFMASAVLVNAGNYYYNVFLGRAVGPAVFAETGILVTFLLILSFLGMTFQIAAAKYIVDVPDHDKDNLKNNLIVVSLISGLLLGAGLWIAAGALGHFFKLSSPWLIRYVALGIPFYLYMSVNRGFLQGEEKFLKLSASYQVEMLSRFAATLILLFVLDVPAGVSVALAISLSIFAGAMVNGSLRIRWSLASISVNKPLIIFGLFTAGYEIVQMMINYCDLALVKHFFEAEAAGHYTSLSLVGRMVYFATWMLVMLLLPSVVNRRKEGKPYQHLLAQYVFGVSLMVLMAVAGCYIFSEEVVKLIFGEEYIAIAPYLWRYGLATGLFAISNIFCYYYLSLGNYRPVFISGVVAILQMIALLRWHHNFDQLILVQIIFMSVTVLAQLIYHYRLHLVDIFKIEALEPSVDEELPPVETFTNS